MTVARIQFQPAKKVSKSKLELWTDCYIDDLVRNGQIMGGERLYCWQDGSLNYYVELARPDALDSQYNSEWVERWLKKVETCLGATPRWSILEDPPARHFPLLKSSSFLFLWSNLNQEQSPVHRANDGQPIPLYLLPIDQFDRQEIHEWQWHDDAYFSIWLKSGALEIPTYRQLADPRSEHVKEGRKYCRIIEQATNIPTYYCLERYYGHRDGKGEEDRPCPVCGKPWRLKDKVKTKKFWEFEFRCDPCRLVSHIATNKASDDEEERHAGIGEFKAGKRNRK